jgi:hypothetical protein
LCEASLRTRRTHEIYDFGLGKPRSGVGVGRSEANIRFTFNLFDVGLVIAPVAQLDRVLASEAKGRGFESRRARHKQNTAIPYESPCYFSS